jgi:hypothetical protein
MSVTRGGTTPKPLRRSGRSSGCAGSAGNGVDLAHGPAVAVAVPGPDGGGQVLQADDAIDEAVSLGRVVGRTELEDELVLLPEVDLLEMLALGEVPEVELSPVAGAEQDLGDESVLEGVRRAPLARDHRVVAEVPPGVVGEELRPTVDLPAAERLEAFVVHQEDAARPAAVRAAERRDIDAAGAAMNGVGPGVARLLGDLLRLDYPDDLRASRVGLGVEDVDAGGAQARHDEVAALDMRVRRVRAEARGAGVPAEMMQFVADVRHRHGVDDAGVGGGGGVQIDHGDGVRLLPVRVEGGHVGDPLRGRLGGQAG